MTAIHRRSRRHHLRRSRAGGNPSPFANDRIASIDANDDTGMDKASYVYLLASKSGTLYLGVTSNLVQRVWQHRESMAVGFSKKYETKKLVWFEAHADIYEAITREKQIKKWRREWKERLIRESNPGWIDLYESICS